MPPTALSADTTPDVERMQFEAWRRMSVADKAALVSGLTQSCVELARAGVRQRYPDASPREQFLRLAVVVLGPELAARAYPECAQLQRA